MPATPACQFYQQLAAIFDATYAPDAGGNAQLLSIGPYRARLRSTSEALAAHLRRPLVPPPLADRGQPASFTFDFVDCRQAGLALPALPWPPDRISEEQRSGEFRRHPFLFTQHGDAVLTAFNVEENRTIAFVRDPHNWPLDHYKQGIFITLYQQLRGHGLHLIHASAIAHQDRALLIAGSGGAGKTTTMLTCIRAGFSFLGDDTTLVAQEPNDDFRIVSLLQTINVTAQTLRWFPELSGHLSATTNSNNKWLVMADEAYPGCLAATAKAHLILVPQITDRARTTLEPAGRLELLRDMLPFSLDLPTADEARQQLDFLVSLLESIPSSRLLLGRDREHLPAILGELLDR